MLPKKLLMLLIAVGFLVLEGCAAMHTSIAKRDLQVQTLMSDTIFLDPVSDDKKTVFVRVHNTTGNNQLDLQRNLNMAFAGKGYQLVQNPDIAHYLVQVNILQVGKTDYKEMDSALNSGFGGALVGATIVGAAGGQGRAMAGAGLAGAAIGLAMDALVNDTYFTLVTDVRISERAKVRVTERSQSTLKQGAGGRQIVNTTEKTVWKRYQTRVISSANKVNLKLEEALPQLVAGISHSVAGIM